MIDKLVMTLEIQPRPDHLIMIPCMDKNMSIGTNSLIICFKEKSDMMDNTPVVVVNSTQKLHLIGKPPILGVSEKMSLSEKGAYLTKGIFFLGHLVETKTFSEILNKNLGNCIHQSIRVTFRFFPSIP